MAVPKIFTSIGNLAARVFGRPGFSPSTRVWGIGTTEVYSPIEQETAISRGFNANTAVYSIVKKYAKKAASIDRYLEDKSTEDPYPNSHPLMMLLKRPNPNQSDHAFFKLVFGNYKLFGEAFIWLNRGDELLAVNGVGELYERTPQEYSRQPVLEMFVIPANHIVVIPDPDDPFNTVGYRLRNRPDVYFRKEDMIHWMDINLDWDEFSRPQLRGMTPLKPGYKTLAADNAATDSMVRMFQNDGAKGALANKTIAPMTPKQETQLNQVMGEKINNKEVKNAIAAFQGDWTYLNFGLTSVDMETLNGREFIYKEFCFLFDVPYGFFDSHTPYAEKQLAARDWISGSIKPDCQELDGELQRVLFIAFGLTDATARICSDFDDLPEMQEDKAKQAEWLMKVWPITPNEVREALDYEPSPDPKMDEAWVPSGFMPVEEALAPDPAEAAYNQLLNGTNGAANNGNGTRKVSQVSR